MLVSLPNIESEKPYPENFGHSESKETDNSIELLFLWKFNFSKMLRQRSRTHPEALEGWVVSELLSQAHPINVP